MPKFLEVTNQGAAQTALGITAAGKAAVTAASIAALRTAIGVDVQASGYNVMNTGNPLTDAIGDGGDHPLSERFDTLAEAQAVFPFVFELGEQIDESAIVLGMNTADVVILPPGTYMSKVGFVWLAGKSLVGQGAVIKATADTVQSALFRASNVNNWHLRGVTFDADGQMDTVVRISNGSADFTMEDVDVTGGNQVGINLQTNTQKGHFRRVHCYGNGGDAITHGGWWIDGTDHEFTDCTSANNEGNGWRLLGNSSTAARNRWLRCKGDSNDYHGFYGVGTRNDPPADYVMTDCTAIGNGSAGLYSGFALHMLDRIRGTGLLASDNTEHGLVLQDQYGAKVEVSGSGNGRELVRMQADFGTPEDAYSGARFCDVEAVAVGNGVGAFTQRGPVSIEGSCHDINIKLIAIDNAGVPVLIVDRVADDFADCFNINISDGFFSGNAGGDDPVNEGSGAWWGRNIVNGTYKHVSGTDSVAETLTNKSLTLPKINTIRDTANNKTVLDLSTNNSASAVNYVYIANAATGADPRVAVGGSDTDVSINLVPKGAGTVKANGANVVTTTGSATLTNKSLTTPQINTIRDTANNKAVLDLSTNNSATAVNYLYIANAAAGGTARIGSAGSDTNIGINLTPKGSGVVTVNGASVSLNATTAVHTAQQVELGHASDTTMTRASAGMVSVEGNPLGTKVAVPASAGATGVVGQWAAEAGWLYVCIAANTWERVATATW